MGNDNHDNDGGAGVSDEEWRRFQEDAAAGTGPALREPSARARMVTERLRATQGQEPPGWRTGPARQGRRRPGRLGAAVAVVLIAGLALIALRPELVIDRITGKADARQEAKNAAPLPAETARPTAAPGAVPRTSRPWRSPSGAPRPCGGPTVPPGSRFPRPPPSAG